MLQEKNKINGKRDYKLIRDEEIVTLNQYNKLNITHLSTSIAALNKEKIYVKVLYDIVFHSKQQKRTF